MNSSKHGLSSLSAYTCTAPLPGGLASSKRSNILMGEIKDKDGGGGRETERDKETERERVTLINFYTYCI